MKVNNTTVSAVVFPDMQYKISEMNKALGEVKGVMHFAKTQQDKIFAETTISMFETMIELMEQFPPAGTYVKVS